MKRPPILIVINNDNQVSDSYPGYVNYTLNYLRDIRKKQSRLLEGWLRSEGRLVDAIRVSPDQLRDESELKIYFDSDTDISLDRRTLDKLQDESVLKIYLASDPGIPPDRRTI